MNELHRPTRRIRGILPDDPRLSPCTLWLRTCTLTPATQQKLVEAIHTIIEESGEFDTFEEVPDEVREPGVATQVPGGEVREEALTRARLVALWVATYGVAGAKRLCAQAGWE